MLRRRKTLTETDQREWANYARTLIPLAGKSLPDLPAEPGIPAQIARPAHPVTPRLIAKSSPTPAVGIHPVIDEVVGCNLVCPSRKRRRR